MKFQGSKYEDDLNQIWNEKVCQTDKEIRRILSSGFLTESGNTSLNSLYNQYKEDFNTVINKIKQLRTSIHFTDNSYIDEYMNNTCQDYVNDFNEYSRLFQAIPKATIAPVTFDSTQLEPVGYAYESASTEDEKSQSPLFPLQKRGDRVTDNHDQSEFSMFDPVRQRNNEIEFILTFFGNSTVACEDDIPENFTFPGKSG